MAGAIAGNVSREAITPSGNIFGEATRGLFFKALKQNLKLKTFVGTCANAVKTQLWTALIAMLILRFLN